MKKLTYRELRELIYKHNEENNVQRQYADKNPLTCVIVFKNDSWPDRDKDFSLKGRSYKFRSDEKFFLPGMCGRSIFAETLDGSDSCRLDWYLGEWSIDYCYILEQKEAN